MYKLSARLKVIVFLVFSFIGLSIVWGVIIYVSLTNHMYLDFHQALEKRARVVADTKFDGNRFSIDDLKLFDLTEKIRNPKDYIYEKVSDDDKYLEWADELGVSPKFFKELGSKGVAFYRDGNNLYSGIIHTKEGQQYYVISSADNHFQGKLISFLEKKLLTVIAISALIAIILSLYVTKFLFRPIKNITRKVQQIRTENLHLRLDEEKNNEEMNHLIRTFNDMLDRIETSFETQNNFISNASHELRTPLTGIIGTADVCLSKTRTPEEYIETLTIILEEANKLDKKTKVLLSLAQTGFNGKIQKFERLRIDQLLWDVKETIEKLNQKNKIHFDTSLLPENSMKLKVVGNEQLLLLAFTNIINNACKYSDHRVVNLSIGSSNNNVFIIVKDTGIGIPKEEIGFIYDLFYRASNTNNYEGYGIGLPLTRNIIKMHKGELYVRSFENVGTTVQVILPIAEAVNDKKNN